MVASCTPEQAVKRVDEPLVPLADVRIAVIPFAYRNYLPFEHPLGRSLSRSVRSSLEGRTPTSAVFVEGGRVEPYLRATRLDQVAWSRVADSLDADVLVTGTIRMVQTFPRPPAGGAAGVGIVDMGLYDARSHAFTLEERLKVRVTTDELPSGDVINAVIDRAADRIARRILTAERPAAPAPPDRPVPAEPVQGERL